MGIVCPLVYIHTSEVHSTTQDVFSMLKGFELKKSKKKKKLCAILVSQRLAGSCCHGEPINLRINFISGHVQCGSWLAIVIFEQSVPVWCRVCVQMNMAYWTIIIQSDGNFWMKSVGCGWILTGISLKLENFLWTEPRLQVVDLHWLWAHVFASDGGSENLWNQTKCTALFAKLRCAMQTEELLLSRDMPILKRTNNNFELILQILPCLEWNDACFLCMESYVGLVCCT